MGEDVYGILTIYLVVSFTNFDGEREEVRRAITSVTGCTLQQARGYKADWCGMNGRQGYLFQWKATHSL